MRIVKPAALLVVAALLFLVSAASAADPVNIQIMALEEQPGAMTLSVSAVDENGKPFPSLQASNFNAWVNDTALIVRGVQTDTARLPASVLLLVDVSGSMAGDPITQARAAMQQFVEALDPNDQVAVMTFAENIAILQDFTADRNLLNQAVGGLTPTGNTALFDGVLQGTAKMAEAPAGRKLIVLLSDGEATIGQGNRAASIEAARAAGVGVVAVGLGSGIDRAYLGELTAASGGRLIEASSGALQQAYTDLAYAIRSQYTLQIEVPRSVDRTLPGTLKVHVIYRADNAFAERHLEPLAGAVPPPFRMSIQGIAPGDRPEGVITLLPTVQEGIEVVKLEYFLDDKVIHTTASGAPGLDLDASTLDVGNHVMKVVATDAAGREGEVQVPFIIPVAASGGGSGLPLLPLLVLALLAGLAYLVWRRFGQEITRRWQTSETVSYESRVSSWASVRTPGPAQRPDEWPERAQPAPNVPATPAEDAVRGRLVLMDEESVRNGALEGIREFEMRSSPLTFGSSPSVDVRVDDVGGMIAAEEARIWVQRGRLVYHKLTTLSAMATEGVTAGWQFLEDGEEMRIGPYRIIFQAVQEEVVTQEVVVMPDRLPQEHGMALRPTTPTEDRFRGRGLRSWGMADGSGTYEEEVPEAKVDPTPAPEVTSVDEQSVTDWTKELAQTESWSGERASEWGTASPNETPPTWSPAEATPEDGWSDTDPQSETDSPPAGQAEAAPRASEWNSAGWTFSDTPVQAEEPAESQSEPDASPRWADVEAEPEESPNDQEPVSGTWGSLAAGLTREWQSGDWDSEVSEVEEENDEPDRAWGT